jgi:RNA-directed DNA polymerase
MNKAKPFCISKHAVWAAYKRVKANQGAAGVDGQSIAQFEESLKSNLYKLWNRMSSGSYFPQAVKRVEIPKPDGNTRPLGIPTVYDRVAQEVVKSRLEPTLDALFHEDSYGFRPGKSAHDAVKKCRERSLEYNWVIDLDREQYFDTIDHNLLLKAVKLHCQEKWMIKYIERWLKSEVELSSGVRHCTVMGTPQGGNKSVTSKSIFALCV